MPDPDIHHLADRIVGAPDGQFMDADDHRGAYDALVEIETELADVMRFARGTEAKLVLSKVADILDIPGPDRNNAIGTGAIARRKTEED